MSRWSATSAALIAASALAAVGAALVVTAAAPSPLVRPIEFPPQSGRARVLITRHLDGDTVGFCWLIDGGTARLYGIDAPEIKGESKVAGDRATECLRRLVPVGLTTVRVHGPDKFGRTLLTLYTLDGKNANLQMVEAGHAKPYFGGSR